MELRTYLSFPQGVVAFLVLIFLLTASITSNWQARSKLYQKKRIARVIFVILANQI